MSNLSSLATHPPLTFQQLSLGYTQPGDTTNGATIVVGDLDRRPAAQRPTDSLSLDLSSLQESPYASQAQPVRDEVDLEKSRVVRAAEKSPWTTIGGTDVERQLQRAKEVEVAEGRPRSLNS